MKKAANSPNGPQTKKWCYVSISSECKRAKLGTGANAGTVQELLMQRRSDYYYITARPNWVGLLPRSIFPAFSQFLFVADWTDGLHSTFSPAYTVPIVILYVSAAMQVECLMQQLYPKIDINNASLTSNIFVSGQCRWRHHRIQRQKQEQRGPQVRLRLR